MATITFRAKVQSVWNEDGTQMPGYIPIPTLKRNHCNMAQFRQHPKYGAYANSDLFHAMLAQIKKDTFGPYRDVIELGQPLPPNVTVDTSGFLARVTIEV